MIEVDDLMEEAYAGRLALLRGYRRHRCQKRGGHRLGNTVTLRRRGDRPVVVARCEECQTEVKRLLYPMDERGMGARDPRAREVVE
jgi:RNase P subunit RPR2